MWTEYFVYKQRLQPQSQQLTFCARANLPFGSISLQPLTGEMLTFTIAYIHHDLLQACYLVNHLH